MITASSHETVAACYHIPQDVRRIYTDSAGSILALILYLPVLNINKYTISHMHISRAGPTTENI